MKKQTKRILALGALCILLIALSSWYTSVFNDSRFVAPMDLSDYVFRVQDLPMILSGILFAGYIVYLTVLPFKSIGANSRQEATAQSTRTVNPKLGFLGLLGFLGQGKLIGNSEYTLIAFFIIVALSMALEQFLSQYLLYHYDQDEALDESEE